MAAESAKNVRSDGYNPFHQSRILGRNFSNHSTRTLPSQTFRSEGVLDDAYDDRLHRRSSYSLRRAYTGPVISRGGTPHRSKDPPLVRPSRSQEALRDRSDSRRRRSHSSAGSRRRRMDGSIASELPPRPDYSDVPIDTADVASLIAHEDVAAPSEIQPSAQHKEKIGGTDIKPEKKNVRFGGRVDDIEAPVVEYSSDEDDDDDTYSLNSDYHHRRRSRPTSVIEGTENEERYLPASSPHRRARRSSLMRLGNGGSERFSRFRERVRRDSPLQTQRIRLQQHYDSAYTSEDDDDDGQSWSAWRDSESSTTSSSSSSLYSASPPGGLNLEEAQTARRELQVLQDKVNNALEVVHLDEILSAEEEESIRVQMRKALISLTYGPYIDTTSSTRQSLKFELERVSKRLLNVFANGGDFLTEQFDVSGEGVSDVDSLHRADFAGKCRKRWSTATIETSPRTAEIGDVGLEQTSENSPHAQHVNSTQLDGAPSREKYTASIALPNPDDTAVPGLTLTRNMTHEVVQPSLPRPATSHFTAGRMRIQRRTERRRHDLAATNGGSPSIQDIERARPKAMVIVEYDLEANDPRSIKHRSVKRTFRAGCFRIRFLDQSTAPTHFLVQKGADDHKSDANQPSRSNDEPIDGLKYIDNSPASTIIEGVRYLYFENCVKVGQALQQRLSLAFLKNNKAFINWGTRPLFSSSGSLKIDQTFLWPPYNDSRRLVTQAGFGFDYFPAVAALAGPGTTDPAQTAALSVRRLSVCFQVRQPEQRYSAGCGEVKNENFLILYDNGYQDGTVSRFAPDIRSLRRSPLCNQICDLKYKYVLSELLDNIFDGLQRSWEDYVLMSSQEVTRLQQHVYYDPADDSLASDLWDIAKKHTQAQRLLQLHILLAQNVHRDILPAIGVNDNIGVLGLLQELHRIETLLKSAIEMPVNQMVDLMYKSISIRDARSSLQLNLSLWRLSWITFIFLPLTWLCGFFGMNVSVMNNNKLSIGWYFIAAAPLMILVILAWLVTKKLARPSAKKMSESKIQDMRV